MEAENGRAYNFINDGFSTGVFIGVGSPLYPESIRPERKKAFPSPPETGKEGLNIAYFGRG